MKYLIIYLAAGTIALAFTLVQHYFTKKKHGPSISETMDDLRLQDAGRLEWIAHKVVVPALAGIGVICLWPVAIVLLIKETFESDVLPGEPAERPVFRVQEQDLIEQLSIDEIEKRELIEDPLGGVPNEPFGHLSHRWQAFVNELSDDAKLWSFAATDDLGYKSIRLEGYVQFDDDEAQSVFVAAKKPWSEED